jgi:hypothetical protein
MKMARTRKIREQLIPVERVRAVWLSPDGHTCSLPRCGRRQCFDFFRQRFDFLVGRKLAELLLGELQLVSHRNLEHVAVRLLVGNFGAANPFEPRSTRRALSWWSTAA